MLLTHVRQNQQSSCRFRPILAPSGPTTVVAASPLSGDERNSLEFSPRFQSDPDRTRLLQACVVLFRDIGVTSSNKRTMASKNSARILSLDAAEKAVTRGKQGG